jgi:hypothetical protein
MKINTFKIETRFHKDGGKPSKDTVLYTDYVDFHTTIISFKEYERRIEQAKQILAWGKTI